MFFGVGDDAVSNMAMWIIALYDRIPIILRSVSPDYWSERSVVDVPAGRYVPPVDCSHHAVEDKGPENDIFSSIFPIMIVVSHFPTSQVDEQSKPLARHLPCGREHRLHCKTPAKCTWALSLFSDQLQLKTKRTSMPSLYESRRKANSSTNSRVISLCRSSGTCRRGLSCC